MEDTWDKAKEGRFYHTKCCKTPLLMIPLVGKKPVPLCGICKKEATGLIVIADDRIKRPQPWEKD